MTLSPSSAEQARRSHSIASALRAGVQIWYALLGPIAAWTIHLVGLASLVQLTCNHPNYEWAQHGLTVVTLAMVAVAMVLSARLARTSPDDIENQGLRFLGQLGLLIGATNGLLIVLEEIYVFAFHTRACV
jgi:hypothetical protein